MICFWGGYYVVICLYIVENYCKFEYFKIFLVYFFFFVVILFYVLFLSNKRIYKIYGGMKIKYKEEMRDKIYVIIRVCLYLRCVIIFFFFKRIFKIK